MPKGVVARVQGVDLTREQYKEFLWRELDLTRVREFVDEVLISRRAAALGVEVSDETLAQRADEQIARTVATRYRGDEARFRATLATRYQTVEAHRRWLIHQLRSELLLERCLLRERAISDEAVRARFERMYGPDGVHSQVRHILVGHRSRSVAVTDDPTRVRAERVMTELEVDPGLFNELVREHSDDRLTKPNDGLIAHYRAGMFGTAFDEALKELETPGQITGPIPSSRGFHILQLVKRTVTRFEDVAAEIRETLKTEQPAATERLNYRKKLRESARVEM